ncbi:MAG: class I SAM-dependent methyltransferase [Chloroflexi bacterium]|nr:class I SAM-dependent methyltransferase [Chloroflexota bacterium]OJV96625.1 MAG: SAM-dependent methyltransferase [Chloroflexi bacterium 54-19]
MKQNKYDNPEFFTKYSQMTRSVKGLAGAGEWETLEKMLPDFQGKRVLDLGCGFGWHCQYAIDHGASAVTGVDISEKMLEVAREKTSPQIRYIRTPVEEAEFPANSFEVVVSSLTFHYLVSFEDIARKVYNWLTAGGDFVFSVEHPIFTAHGSQDFYRDAGGNPLFFPVDHYFSEGQRDTTFLGEKVTKYHKTLTTYLSALLQNGFTITGVVEPQPPAHMLAASEGMKDELRRPMMLIISARK